MRVLRRWYKLISRDTVPTVLPLHVFTDLQPHTRYLLRNGTYNQSVHKQLMVNECIWETDPCVWMKIRVLSQCRPTQLRGTVDSFTILLRSATCDVSPRRDGAHAGVRGFDFGPRRLRHGSLLRTWCLPAGVAILESAMTLNPWRTPHRPRKTHPPRNGWLLLEVIAPQNLHSQVGNVIVVMEHGVVFLYGGHIRSSHLKVYFWGCYRFFLRTFSKMYFFFGEKPAHTLNFKTTIRQVPSHTHTHTHTHTP